MTPAAIVLLILLSHFPNYGCANCKRDPFLASSRKDHGHWWCRPSSSSDIVTVDTTKSTYDPPRRFLEQQGFASPCLVCVSTVPRGGAAQARSSPSPAVDGFDYDDAVVLLQSVGNAGKKLWTNHVTPFLQTKVLPVVQDPQTHLIKPLHDFWYNQTQGAQQRRRDCYTASGITTVGTSIVFSPTRWIKLLLGAWVLAESLSWAGLLPSDDTNDSSKRRQETFVQQLKRRIHRFRFDTKCRQVQEWLNSVRLDPRALWMPLEEHLPPRYQWALGSTAGILLAPSIRFIVQPLFFLGLYAFLLGESNRVLRNSQGWEWEDPDEYQGNNKWMYTIEIALEQWRQVVRYVVENQREVFASVKHEVHTKMHDEWLIPPSFENGLYVGVVLGWIADL